MSTGSCAMPKSTLSDCHVFGLPVLVGFKYLTESLQTETTKVLAAIRNNRR